jgi:small subunit ribosomal protein S6
VISLKKWDERRLCYDIQGKSRGTYILVYFNCETERVNHIERDVQLSELMVRSLILRTEAMSTEDIEQLTPLEAMEASAAAAEQAAAEKVEKAEAEAATAKAAESDVDDRGDADAEDTELADDAEAEADAADDTTEPA